MVSIGIDAKLKELDQFKVPIVKTAQNNPNRACSNPNHARPRNPNKRIVQTATVLVLPLSSSYSLHGPFSMCIDVNHHDSRLWEEDHG